MYSDIIFKTWFIKQVLLDNQDARTDIVYTLVGLEIMICYNVCFVSMQCQQKQCTCSQEPHPPRRHGRGPDVHNRLHAHL